MSISDWKFDRDFHYKPFETLGVGAGTIVKKGEVIQSCYLGPSTIVAVKEYQPDVDSKKVEEIEKNMMPLIEKIDSPYIIKPYCFFKKEGNLCLAMEYTGDGDLSTYVQKKKAKKTKIPDEVVRKIMAELVVGLFVLHRNDPHILHRDMKTSNVLMFGDDIKITDFGISKQTEGTLAAVTVYGKSPYLPLEAEGDYTDKWDVYALGKIFKIIATTKSLVPFESLPDVLQTLINSLDSVGDNAPHIYHETYDPATKVKDLIFHPYIRSAITELLPTNTLPLKLRQAYEQNPILVHYSFFAAAPVLTSASDAASSSESSPPGLGVEVGVADADAGVMTVTVLDSTDTDTVR